MEHATDSDQPTAHAISDPSNSHAEGDDQPPPAPSTSLGLSVELFDTSCRLSTQSSDQIQRLACRALSAFPNTGQIRVRVVDDTQMSRDHEQFSGIVGTTDVLTFDLSEPAIEYESKVLDVDLTVCIDEAHRQAELRNHPIEHELLLYILHGTLHCLGYDDHDDDEYQRMHKEEDALFRSIGLPPVFFTEDAQQQNQHKEFES